MPTFSRACALPPRFEQAAATRLDAATHGHTAAEIVYNRDDEHQPHTGLNSWKNVPAGPVRKADVTIAKNYLYREEIKALNLIVSAYLDFAEL
jgi:hypothetical protein